MKRVFLSGFGVVFFVVHDKAGTGFLRQNHLRALLRKQGVKSATEAGWVTLRRDMKGPRAMCNEDFIRQWQVKDVEGHTTSCRGSLPNCCFVCQDDFDSLIDAELLANALASDKLGVADYPCGVCCVHGTQFQLVEFHLTCVEGLSRFLKLLGAFVQSRFLDRRVASAINVQVKPSECSWQLEQVLVRVDQTRQVFCVFSFWTINQRHFWLD